ncbi:hypothetical protein HG536_0B05830 [Torulaspora globosa]|uniref:pyridoxal kinase n=1 Tax=Torulaspora globosa TaxID=48254 RepID=A0A7G3ZDY2_9SACH|nr:uncharacterized protein HG536_0B05830 [Torulaspora globosa]QLL31718.1 hypothetical protein HG536_0B05830 [Torulaspora globosa]
MPRLLATQSHVVHGFVGNKAATFPLQCYGWDVDCCNSVQYSNHTGYGMHKVFGNITEEKDLDQLLSGVLANFANDYEALLSGYLPKKESVRCMGQHYTAYKRENPNSVWLMDPVMGDEGQLYVEEDVIEEYRKLALSSHSDVDIMTPNHFELEIICGKSIDTVDQLKSVLQELHETVPVVIVTSCDEKIFSDPHHVYCVASMKGNAPVVLRVPLIKSYFTGVGDLFSALLLDRVYKLLSLSDEGLKLEHQVNDVLNVIQGVLKITLAYAPKNHTAKIGNAVDMKNAELRIIESRHLFSEDVATESKQNFIYREL